MPRARRPATRDGAVAWRRPSPICAGLTNFDHLYVGGGNAKRLTFEPNPDITFIDNEAGIDGGAHAWRD